MKMRSKALASLAIAGLTLTTIPFNAFAEEAVPTRLGGFAAEQTAVKIADQTGWTGTAILASSTSYGMVDALTVSPLATYVKAPILLTEAGNVLNADTKAELIKLNITKVYVTSGTAVISQAVLNELNEMNIAVESLGGIDRFATSANIAQKMVSLGAPVNKVAVAYGWLNQDALSIASLASAQTEPILLTEKETIPASVQAFLDTNTSVQTTDVIGGTGVISDAVRAQLPSATRYYGNTAYDTNVAVLKAFDSVIQYDNVFLANGETAIDAIAGAPLAANFNAAIVLTNGTVNEGTAYVSSKLSATSVVTALGGTAVVPESVLNSVVYSGSETPPVTPPVTPPTGGGGGGGGSSSTKVTLDKVVAEIMTVRGYLNPSEKESLNQARTNLSTAVQDGTLSSTAEGLMTDQVVAAFVEQSVTREDAKAAIIKFLQDFQAIHYSDDKATLKTALEEFKANNEGTFRTLFGDDFKVELFYGFLMATQEELSDVIKNDELGIYGLVGAPSTDVKDQLVEWTRVALHNVADPTKSKYHVFDQKLSAIGWNLDLLVDTQRQIGTIVDSSNAAEKAVAMSMIRSQIQCKVNGRISDPLTPVILKKGTNRLVLSVKEINTGSLNLAGQLAWKSENLAIALVEVADDAASIQAGTTQGTTVITAYKKDTLQIEANELVRISVTVK